MSHHMARFWWCHFPPFANLSRVPKLNTTLLHDRHKRLSLSGRRQAGDDILFLFPLSCTILKSFEHLNVCWRKGYLRPRDLYGSHHTREKKTKALPNSRKVFSACYLRRLLSWRCFAASPSSCSSQGPPRSSPTLGTEETAEETKR